MGRRARGLVVAHALWAAAAMAQSDWVTSPLAVDVPVAGESRDLIGLGAASDGTDFLVAWSEQDFILPPNVATALVRADGGVSSGPRFVVSSNIPTVVSAGFDGTQYLFAYGTSDGGAGMIAVQGISTSGSLGQSWGFDLSGGIPLEPSIAVSGPGQFALAWSDYQQIVGALVSPGNEVAVSGAGAACPQIGWTGSGFYVVWRQALDAGSDVYGATLQPDGTVIPPGGLSLTSVPGLDVGCPALSCEPGGVCVASWTGFGDGGGSFALWISDGGAAFGQPVSYAPVGIGSGNAVALGDAGTWLAFGSEAIQVDASGGPLAAFPSALPAGYIDATASSADQVLFAAEALVPLVSASFLTSAGAAPAIDVYTPLNLEISPTVGCGPDQCLILWADDRQGHTNNLLGAQFWGVRVDPVTGTVLDSLPFVITPPGVFVSVVLPPAVAVSASGYLVVSLQSLPTGEAIAQRLDFDGGVLDSVPLSLGPAPYTSSWLAAASNGVDFLVSWWGQTSGQSVTYAGRVGADGSTPDAPGLLLDSASGPLSIASNGADYLVVWSASLVDGGNSVRARAVYDDGGVGPLRVLDERPGLLWAGDVFVDGGYLAVWGEASDGGEWLVASLASDGSLVGSPVVTPAPIFPIYPWAQLVPAPYGVFALGYAGADGGALLYDGWALSPAGGNGVGAPALSVLYPPAPAGPVSMAPTLHGAIVVSPEYDAPDFTVRTNFRLLTFDHPLAHVCQADAECASGVCDSNVCCAARGACTPPDAGSPDSGVPDSGTPDAGPQGPARSVSDLGCGCEAGAAPAWGAALLLCLGRRNRRRKRKGAP